MAQELIFIRHGETEWNQAGRLQGRGDSPLTARGRAQVSAHRQWLLAHPPQRLLVSPLGRAQATASILLQDLALVPETRAELAERCMGRYEGWTLAELERHAPADARARREDVWGFRAPDGENYDDMLERARPLLEELRTSPSSRIALVSHGSLVRPMLGYLLGLSRSEVVQLLQPNDTAYRLVLGDRPAVYWHRGDETGEGLLWLEP